MKQCILLLAFVFVGACTDDTELGGGPGVDDSDSPEAAGLQDVGTKLGPRDDSWDQEQHPDVTPSEAAGDVGAVGSAPTTDDAEPLEDINDVGAVDQGCVSRPDACVGR